MAPKIIIKTQKEWDTLPKSFDDFTLIRIETKTNIWLAINNIPGNSHVEAWGNSHVVARGNSHVEARGNSHVEARGNSHVEARENSHVVAWENSHVVAWGNSHVEAWGSVAVHLHSDLASCLLFAFAVCFELAKGKATKKSKTAMIIKSERKSGTDGWLEAHGIEPEANIILYKRASKDYKTQEGTPNETLWAIGATLTHPSWSPKDSECGEGKFHACAKPYFCDDFRNNPGDKYIAIEVKRKDLYAWPNPCYPHKIAFREGKVLYECDRYGNEIKN